jgi:hypothetical protein
MNPNSRDGQRRIAQTLINTIGRNTKSNLAIKTRKMRKLQCQLLIHALLNGKKVKVTEKGDLKVRL